MLEASGTPQVVWDEGKRKLPLERIGATDVYAAVITVPSGFAARWHFEVDGKSIEKAGREPINASARGSWKFTTSSRSPPPSPTCPTAR